MAASKSKVFELVLFSPQHNFCQLFRDHGGCKILSLSRRFSSNVGGFSSDEIGGSGKQNPPQPIPNRPLRGESRIYRQPGSFSASGDRHQVNNGFSRSRNDANDEIVVSIDDDKALKGKKFQSPTLQFLNKDQSDKQLEESFLEKFKLATGSKVEKGKKEANAQVFRGGEENDAKPVPEPSPQDADEIFRKMKETGLIPNAVAMLDGLCKDGLVQEAMKLFGLMREKGTIPEVVIYTAVVEGFCKSHKFDDAKRIFRKMQNNGIVPNAFSYTVLIQGLYKCNKLEDAIEFCVEMLENGHSPNIATLVGVVDAVSREKGVEEAKNVIATFKQKGYFLDEKNVREYLDKKAPFSPMIWEAMLGKKIAQRPF